VYSKNIFSFINKSVQSWQIIQKLPKRPREEPGVLPQDQEMLVIPTPGQEKQRHAILQETRNWMMTITVAATKAWHLMKMKMTQ